MRSITDIPTLEQIIERMTDRVLAVAPDVDVSANSAVGQLIGIVANEAAAAYDYARHAALQTYRSTATGPALDQIAEIVGVTRITGAGERSLVFARGIPVSNDDVTVVRVMEGRYAYLRSSMRWTDGATEQTYLRDSGGVANGSLITHESTTISAPVALTAAPGTSLNAVVIEGRLQDGETISGDGWTIYGTTAYIAPGVPDESDDAFRARIRMPDATPSTSPEGIVAALAQRGIAATVTSNTTQTALPSGQPPHSIMIAISGAGGLSNERISAAIRACRPAGIGTWSPPGSPTSQGETWTTAAGTGIAVNVIGVTPSISTSDRQLVEAYLMQAIGSHSGAMMYASRIEAAVIVQMPNLLELNITLNGARELGVTGSTTVVSIDWSVQ